MELGWRSTYRGDKYTFSVDPGFRLVGMEVLENRTAYNKIPQEVDALAVRERGFDIVPVEYEGAKRNGWTYMFIARKSKGVNQRVRDDILPNESALATCMTGACTYGREFLDMWISSCYLADGTGLANHPYYKKLIAKFLDTIEQVPGRKVKR